MPVSVDSLTQFIVDSFGASHDEFEADTRLFSSGILDSFNLVELISYIESESGISIRPTEVTLENLDSIQRILSFIREKRASGSTS